MTQPKADQPTADQFSLHGMPLGKIMSRLPPRKEALRDLAIRSRNKCAFPGCDQPLLNMHGVYVAELCHIEAAEQGGQRYNLDQTDEERRAPANLLFLCHQHHKETDDEKRYPVEELRRLKLNHEALPEVVFNTNLLLGRIEEVLTEQAAIRSLLGATGRSPTQDESFLVAGPELQDSWTPEIGRFYETRTGLNTKFKYMMRDGWLHVDQQLEDGAVAYYELNEQGSVRNSRFPYPIDEYRVRIPDELILQQEKVSSEIGTHAIKTTLKWSKGTVTEHFVGSVFKGVDCQARSTVDHGTRTIAIL